MDVGWERSRNLSSTLTYRPEITSWLRAEYTYTSRYGTDRNPSYLELTAEGADTTAEMQRRFEGQRQIARRFTLQLLDDVGATGVIEPVGKLTVATRPHHADGLAGLAGHHRRGTAAGCSRSGRPGSRGTTRDRRRSGTSLPGSATAGSRYPRGGHRAVGRHRLHQRRVHVVGDVVDRAAGVQVGRLAHVELAPGGRDVVEREAGLAHAALGLAVDRAAAHVRLAFTIPPQILRPSHHLS